MEKEKLIKEKKIKKENSLPPIADNEIPFEIPNSWKWSRLGNISSKIGSGSTPRGSDYSEKGIPFFRSQNIHDKGLIYNDIKYIPKLLVKQKSFFVITKLQKAVDSIRSDEKSKLC